jgi:RNA polymerase sigma-70 factor (ECF subfamily)
MCDLGKLITAAKSGSQQALDEFVRRTEDRVYRYALGQLRSQELAGEATQETFLRMLRSLDRWKDGADPVGLLLGVSRNVAREFWRRRKHDPLGDPPSSDSNHDPVRLSIVSEQNERLLDAIELLPRRQREVVAMRIFEELTVEQAARAMKCRPGTVKALLSKAVVNLRKHVARFDGHP